MKVLCCKVLSKVEIKKPTQELIQRGKDAVAFAGGRFRHGYYCSPHPKMSTHSLEYLQPCIKCRCTCYVVCAERGIITDKMLWQDEYCVECKKLVRYTYYVDISWNN